MKTQFKAIRITDLDIDLTQPSDEEPRFQRLYLKLSEEPPPEWVKIFEQARRFPRRQIWRNAWVVESHIVVECIPEELEQEHLNHLKEDVATENKKCLSNGPPGTMKKRGNNSRLRRWRESNWNS